MKTDKDYNEKQLIRHASGNAINSENNKSLLILTLMVAFVGICVLSNNFVLGVFVIGLTLYQAWIRSKRIASMREAQKYADWWVRIPRLD